MAHQLVETLEDLRRNCLTFEEALRSKDTERSSLARELVARGTCFVQYRGSNGASFAPAKFVGYSGNGVELHKRLHQQRDGEVGKRAICAVLGLTPEVDDGREETFQEFCRNWGVSATGSFGRTRRYWDLTIELEMPPKRRRVGAENERRACQISSQVFDGRMTEKQGVNVLAGIGVNETSARDYIVDYKALCEGRKFQRGMSAGAMDLFIQSIWDLRGHDALRNAVKALDLHIVDAEKRSGAPGLRRVADKYRAKLSPAALSSESLEKEFEDAVRRSQADSSANREKRLAAAPKIPQRIPVAGSAFVRNPDVVAAVLDRAKGTCEECRNPAPFRRVIDGTPYLEVHHRLPLAQGGEDSVANAMAVCPNCHRRLH